VTDEAAIRLLQLLGEYGEDYPETERDVTVKGLVLDLVETTDFDDVGRRAGQRAAKAWGVAA
jgi:hypothetical protein